MLWYLYPVFEKCKQLSQCHVVSLYVFDMALYDCDIQTWYTLQHETFKNHHV